jgi:nucleoside-diphosphate-sugar epimerase
MKALIFGCGYLGRRVATQWLNDGHHVHAVTRSAEAFATFQEMGIQPILADVCEPETLKELPAVDTILYSIAFDRRANRSREEVTCFGLRNVLDRVRDQCSRFIYISTSSVYGQTTGEWVDETSECQPTSEGGQLNLAAENLVRDSFQMNGSGTATILRLAGIYGPGRLLTRIEALRAGQPLAGKPDAWLNLIHVDDAASAIIECANDPGQATTYNVVDDRPVLRSDYFGLLARLVGAPDPVFDPSRPTARGSGGLNKRCSNRKIRTDLSWMPKYATIETGLPASIAKDEG